jgi:DNA-binding LacI/PurR family transcriptional regulator
MVKKALDRNNYLPNQVARSLKAKATNTVGIIVPDIRDYFAYVIKGVEEVLSKSGYSIILADTNEDSEKEDLYVRLLHEKRVDGLILATVSTDNSALKLLGRSAIPVVFIDNLPNLPYGIDAVLLNNFKASSIAVEHLLRFGHRKIAVICGDQRETTTKERLAGYLDALEANSIASEPDLIEYGSFTVDSGCQCMRRLLDRMVKSGFTAVYVTSYKMTCGAIKALKERKVSFPGDVSLVGFDFTDENKLFSPSITSILQPVDNIGRLVAHRILAKIHDSDAMDKTADIPQKILLDPILEIGESVAQV